MLETHRSFNVSSNLPNLRLAGGYGFGNNTRRLSFERFNIYKI